MRLYSRALLRKIMRAHLPPHMRLHGPNTDILIYLAYLMFLQNLANESRLQMQMDRASGLGGISDRQILRRHILGAGRKLLRRHR